eukprot:gene9194-16333_t
MILLVAANESSRPSRPMWNVPMINVAPFPGPGGTAFAVADDGRSGWIRPMMDVPMINVAPFPGGTAFAVADNGSSGWIRPMMDVPMINVAPFPGGTAFAVADNGSSGWIRPMMDVPMINVAPFPGGTAFAVADNGSSGWIRPMMDVPMINVAPFPGGTAFAVADDGSSGWIRPMSNVPMINVAPFPGPGGTAFAVSAPKNSSMAAYVTFSLASYLATPALSIGSIMSSTLDAGPFRNSHFSAESLEMLISAGYNEQETTDYMQTMQISLGHPNNVDYFNSPGASLLLIGLRDATNIIIRGDPSIPYIKLVESVIGNVLMSVTPFQSDLLGASAALMVDAYLREIGYKPAPIPPPAPSPPSALVVTSINYKNDLHTAAVIGIIIGSIVALLASSLALWRWLRVRKRKNTSAPGVSPSTTILVTDIQDSTTMWEQLPACIRQQLLHFGGYESATEGDSFIVAFHTPADALDFAISAQMALLEADWPAELLDSPFGAQVTAYTPHLANAIPLLANRKRSKAGQLDASSPSGAIPLGAKAALPLMISGLGRLKLNGFTLTVQNSLVVQSTEGATPSFADASKTDRMVNFRAGSCGANSLTGSLVGNKEQGSSSSISLSVPETTTLQSALARVYAIDSKQVWCSVHCGPVQHAQAAYVRCSPIAMC